MRSSLDSDARPRRIGSTSTPASPRIALYSPGMVGLGHMRRSLLVAQRLACSSMRPAILLLAEARQATEYTAAMPPGMDCLTLPALRKEATGECRPRYLPLPFANLVTLRSETIRAALAAFAPDVLIVDHLPGGAGGELVPALQYLRARGSTRCVLGLRDVLEHPATVREEWRRGGHLAAIRAHYDAVWVYADPVLYDLAREYNLPGDVAAKVLYTGYLDQRRRLEFAAQPATDPVAQLALPPGRLALCLVGGGQDGGALAKAFVRAWTEPSRLPDTNGVVLTGPFMPAAVRARLRRHAAGHPRLRVLDFVPEPGVLLRRADRIVAMGGYNTTLEVLSFEKRALIVPRGGRRTEQAIRAERLRALGLVDVLPAAALSPAALGEWLARDAAPPQVRRRIDLDGLERIPQLVEQVLQPALLAS